MDTAEIVLDIRTESPLTEDSTRLIAGSQAALETVYSADEIFTLEPAELAHPNVQFLVARLSGKAVGCVALVDMQEYGEVKRLYVDESARGLGLGRKLVEALEGLAKDIGLRVLRLETGPELAPALRIYEQMGYMPRDRFGDYEQLACSLFMEKTLL